MIVKNTNFVEPIVNWPTVTSLSYLLLALQAQRKVEK